MALITNEPIALVEYAVSGVRGQHIETYQSRVAMIMSLMNHGGTGGGSDYGGPMHCHALDMIEKHLAECRRLIKQHNDEYGEKPPAKRTERGKKKAARTE